MSNKTMAPEIPAQKSVRLTQSGSLLLDVVRFLAAFIVLVHHFVSPLFSQDRTHIGVLGHEAVCVFFVLSGFVIRFITVTRVSTLREYVIDRVSRIYSVVIPAILFTMLCELLAYLVHPAAYGLIYAGSHDAPFHWSLLLQTILSNLTFTAGAWGYGDVPLCNGPFWSLSFEIIYYVLYAVLQYRIPYRWLWTFLLLLFAGPNIAILSVVWFLGAYTCDVYLHCRKRAAGVKISGFILALLLGIVFLVRHPFTRFVHATDHNARLAWMTQAVSGWHLPSFLLVQGYLPWLSQVSISFCVVGLLTAALMLFGLLAVDRLHPDLPPAVTRWTRLVADSTFTLYLFHLPMIVLVVSLVGHPIASVTLGNLTILGIVLVAIPIAVFLDRIKNWMRSALRHRFPARSA